MREREKTNQEMKLHWTWAALAIFTLALVLGGNPGNDTGVKSILSRFLCNLTIQILRIANIKHKTTTVEKLQMIRAPELESSSTCSL